jgi:hypothetical protein
MADPMCERRIDVNRVRKWRHERDDLRVAFHKHSNVSYEYTSSHRDIYLVGRYQSLDRGRTWCPAWSNHLGTGRFPRVIPRE